MFIKKIISPRVRELQTQIKVGNGPDLSTLLKYSTNLYFKANEM
jgi:hypothetical protein